MTDNSFDPFALARESDSENELLTAYRLLPPDKAAAAVSLLQWSAGLDKSEAPAQLPEPAKPAKPELNPADRARLRRACEELAAEYRAPLPDGDAGLSAAIERWQRLKHRHHFGCLLGIDYTLGDEKAIIEPTSTAAEIEFENMIEKWPVRGLAGAAAKLRYLFENGHAVDIEDIDGEQLIAVIEREAGRVAQ